MRAGAPQTSLAQARPDASAAYPPRKTITGPAGSACEEFPIHGPKTNAKVVRGGPDLDGYLAQGSSGSV